MKNKKSGKGGAGDGGTGEGIKARVVEHGRESNGDGKQQVGVAEVEPVGLIIHDED